MRKRKWRRAILMLCGSESNQRALMHIDGRTAADHTISFTQATVAASTQADGASSSSTGSNWQFQQLADDARRWAHDERRHQVGELVAHHLLLRPHARDLQLHLGSADGVPPQLTHAFALTELSVLTDPAAPQGGSRLWQIGLPGLQRLALGGFQLHSDNDWQPLQEMRTLLHLDLRGCSLGTPASTPSMLAPQNFSQLTSLALGPLERVPEWVGKLKNLHSLSLHGMESLHDADFAMIRNLTHLRHLSLQQCNVTALPPWFTSETFPQLNELHINGAKLSCLPPALLKLDANVVLANAGMSARAMEAARIARGQAKARGEISGSFGASAPHFGEGVVAMREHVRDVWESQSAQQQTAPLQPTRMQARIPADLQRLQEVICTHMSEAWVAAEAVFITAPGREAAIRTYAIRATLADFENVHESRINELSGHDANFHLQRAVIRAMAAEITPTDKSDLEILSEVIDVGSDAAAARGSSHLMPSAAEWSRARMPTAAASSSALPGRPAASSAVLTADPFADTAPLVSLILLHAVASMRSRGETMGDLSLAAKEVQQRYKEGERLAISYGLDVKQGWVLDAVVARAVMLRHAELNNLHPAVEARQEGKGVDIKFQRSLLSAAESLLQPQKVLMMQRYFGPDRLPANADRAAPQMAPSSSSNSAPLNDLRSYSSLFRAAAPTPITLVDEATALAEFDESKSNFVAQTTATNDDQMVDSFFAPDYRRLTVTDAVAQSKLGGITDAQNIGVRRVREEEEQGRNVRTRLKPIETAENSSSSSTTTSPQNPPSPGSPVQEAGGRNLVGL